MEIWKDIEWYEWLYQVSNLWRVKSLNYARTKLQWLLKPNIMSRWHSIVWFKQKRIKQELVHRLVALHFIPNPDKLPIVCHKEEKLDDNWALYNWSDNLFWWTQKDNIQDMYKKWRANNHLQVNHPWKWIKWWKHYLSKKIEQVSKNWEFIKEWWSIIDASNILLISSASIWKVCRWERKTAGWFIFNFI